MSDEAPAGEWSAAGEWRRDAGWPPARPPAPAGPPLRRRRRRSRRRRVWLAVGIPLVVLALLAGLDRLAASYAASQIATRIQGYGFPVRPSVTIEGFPFLTQVISRHFDGIDISAPSYPAGPVTADIRIRAAGIDVAPGYHSGTVARITGTGLITFASIARVAAAVGVPGLSLARAGPHRVRLTARLAGLAATATARVRRTGSSAFGIRILAANGVPAAVLGRIRHLTIRLPRLPLGLAVRGVTVTGQGVLLTVTGTNVAFGG